MKTASVKILAVIALALAAAAASATNYTPPVVTPPTTPPVTIPNPNPTVISVTPSATSNADAWSAGGSVGNVAGGSVGPVSNTAQGGLGGSATGGQGGLGGSATRGQGGLGGSATGGQGGLGGAANATGGLGGSVGAINTAGGQGGTSNSNATGAAAAGDSSASANTGPSYAASQAGAVTNQSDSKYLSLSLPQPVWTMVPQAFGCVVSKSQAVSVGWNLISTSKTEQVSEAVCTTIRMAEAATLHCQYATAAHLNKRAYEQMYAGSDGTFFLAGEPKNLTLAECEAIKRPVLRVAPTMVAPVVAPAPVACVAPKRVKRVATHFVAKRKCVNCCTN